MNENAPPVQQHVLETSNRIEIKFNLEVIAILLIYQYSRRRCCFLLWLQWHLLGRIVAVLSVVVAVRCVGWSCQKGAYFCGVPAQPDKDH